MMCDETAGRGVCLSFIYYLFCLDSSVMLLCTPLGEGPNATLMVGDVYGAPSGLRGGQFSLLKWASAGYGFFLRWPRWGRGCSLRFLPPSSSSSTTAAAPENKGLTRFFKSVAENKSRDLDNDILF